MGDDLHQKVWCTMRMNRAMSLLVKVITIPISKWKPCGQWPHTHREQWRIRVCSSVLIFCWRYTSVDFAVLHIRDKHRVKILPIITVWQSNRVHVYQGTDVCMLVRYAAFCAVNFRKHHHSITQHGCEYTRTRRFSIRHSDFKPWSCHIECIL